MLPYGGKATSTGGRRPLLPSLVPARKRLTPAENVFPVPGKCALRPREKLKPNSRPVAPAAALSFDYFPSFRDTFHPCALSILTRDVVDRLRVLPIPGTAWQQSL